MKTRTTQKLEQAVGPAKVRFRAVTHPGPALDPAAAMESGDRRWPRASVRGVAQWTSAGGIRCSGQICDVSAGGFFIRPMTGETSRIPAGTRLTISYVSRSEGEGAISVAATVRWNGISRSHACYGFGVEFTMPDVPNLAA